MATPDTQSRILDAAEELFAEDGYEATSLRAVTREAEVNLAAVHYHFGGKLQLFQAVIERRVEHINRERLRMLDEVEARANSSPQGALDLEEILEAFLAPAIRLAGNRDEGHARFMRIMGRVVSTTGEHVHAIRPVFQEIMDRFFPAFGRALPHLAPTDIQWRFHFLLGSMAMHMVDPQRIQIASGGACSSDDPEEVLRQLIAHAAGAFRTAPARVDSLATGGSR